MRSLYHCGDLRNLVRKYDTSQAAAWQVHVQTILIDGFKSDSYAHAENWKLLLEYR